MKAAPAFQFYPDRWLGGTRRLSFAARGIYIDLLALQWTSNQALPSDLVILARVLGCPLAEFEPLWAEVSHKFTLTPSGYVNDALERVRGEGETFRQSQAAKGRKGAAARWLGHSPVIDRANSPANGPRMASISDLDLYSRSSDLDLGRAEERARALEPPPSGSKTEGQERAQRDEPHPETGNAPKTINGVTWTAPLSSAARTSPNGLFDGRAARRHGTHAWCAPEREGLCIPPALHAEFLGKSGKPDAELRTWYAATLDKFAGQAIGDDCFDFWRHEFANWVGVVTSKPVRRETKDSRTRAAAATVRQQIAENGGVLVNPFYGKSGKPS